MTDDSNNSSDDASILSESYYNDARWPLIRVLNWIAFRDPARISNSNWFFRIYQPDPSDTDSDPLPKVKPRKRLLQALQEGKVSASLEGQMCTARFWDSVQPHELLKKYSDAWFLRDEVLKYFPKTISLNGLASNLKNARFIEALKAEKSKHGRDLTSREAERIASTVSGINQKEARELLKSIQGSKKPGPRGPRKSP